MPGFTSGLISTRRYKAATKGRTQSLAGDAPRSMQAGDSSLIFYSLIPQKRYAGVTGADHPHGFSQRIITRWIAFRSHRSGPAACRGR